MKAREALLEEEVFNAIKNQQKLVLMLSTTTCPPCKRLTPIFFEVSEKYEDIAFLKVHLDELPKVNSVVSAGSVPTLVFYKGGVEKYRSLGYMEKASLENLIETHLG
ncbi:thioredoxin [Mycoplasma haemofelis str. Langford 1]|uniref:Thioredoxin n=2 Tax=Mycoplasma haemofelis TaxID=29501 RepID=F6FIH7_MYCHI|nr:thioredoxin domain-containing protein [Mycoplasma haemofelis]AEG73025.1 thioredoxin [Mycoplasma haemofelis Ohio2]CBY92691.1 thioredoxin [Mycoplasma haemofelis str. Langford 1]